MKIFYWNNNEIRITLKIYDKKHRYNEEGLVEKIELYTNDILSMNYFWGCESLLNQLRKYNKSYTIDDVDFYDDEIIIYNHFDSHVIKDMNFYKWLYSCLSLNYSRNKKINNLLN